MKFSLIILLAGLCLMAVSANIEVSTFVEDLDENDYDYNPNDVAEDVTDIDEYVSWFGIYFIIRMALSFIKGVKCTVKEVYEIKGAAETFLEDIQQCGDDVNAKVQKLITTCKNIVITSSNIININESVCGNSAPETTDFDDDPTVATFKGKTHIKCFFKLLGKTLKLKNQVKSAIRLIKQIPKVPGEANNCVNTAVQHLGSVFNQFPASVKYCSKFCWNKQLEKKYEIRYICLYGGIVPSGRERKLGTFNNLIKIVLKSDYSFQANATGDFSVEYDGAQLYESVDRELDDEVVEIQPRTIFSGMYWTLKKVLKTLKGLNCAIKEVIVIHGAATKFVNDVKVCGGEATQKVQTLIDACNDIIETCKNILGINESICGNTVDVNSDIQSRTWNVVKGAQNGHKCFVQMLRKLQTLNKQINRAIKLIKQIRKVPGDTSKCVLNAVDTLEGNFNQFPINVKTCSKLVNNKK
ncbi:uncharacterized protein ACRADG_008740 [Cochliomyia hominivorax]